jgi:PHD-zinc-finger like domain
MQFNTNREKCCMCLKGSAQEKLTYCTICNAPVHASCYTWSTGPELVCMRCEELLKQKGAYNAYRCFLCRGMEGILIRREKCLEWVHWICVRWIPNMSLNEKSLSIVGYENALSKSCNKSICIFCGSKNGITIKCKVAKCGKYFHVTCGVDHNCVLSANEMRRISTDKLLDPIYCPDHMDKARRNKNFEQVIQLGEKRKLESRKLKKQSNKQNNQAQSNGKGKAIESEEEINSALLESDREEEEKEESEEEMRENDNNSEESHVSNNENSSSSEENSESEDRRRKKKKIQKSLKRSHSSKRRYEAQNCESTSTSTSIIDTLKRLRNIIPPPFNQILPEGYPSSTLFKFDITVAGDR